MPKYTPNLNIQLADPATDGNQTFNIETMINDPVEKLDEALGLVPVSGDVRAATTGNIVLNGAQTIDGIALAAGNRVLVKNQTAGKENGIYTVSAGPWTRTADADTTAKLAAGVSVYVEEGTANGKSRWQMANTGAVTLDTTALIFEKTGGPGSATDTVIGSRTVSDATAPTGDSGTVTTLLGWLANMVKAITGGATWRTLPAMSITAIKAILDAATNAATASALMKRDANGRAQVAAPAAAGDIARKDTVDGAIAAHKAEADPHGQYVKKAGDTLTGSLDFPANKGIAVNGKSGIYNDGSVTFFGDITTQTIINGNSFLLNTPSGLKGLPSATNGDLTYYVRTDGSDSNTGTANTAAGAFKTIGKAISMIPQIVNHNVDINVGAGTYAEGISLRSFSGNGIIRINGAASVADTHVVSFLYVTGCSCQIVVTGIKTTIPNATPFYIERSRVELWYCKTDVQEIGYTQGINVTTDGSVSCVGCSISNRTSAIIAHYNSRINIDGGTGTNLRDRFIAQYNSTVSYYNNPLFTSTHGDAVFNGGIIYAGGYPGTVNPWGDNTYDNRIIGQYYHNTAWNAVANTDNLMSFYSLIKQSAAGSGWDMGALFTAPQNGWYTFIVTVNYYNATAGMKLRLHLVKNEFYAHAMGEIAVPTGYTNGLLKGIARVYFTAGETARIALNPTASCTIHNEMQSTNLTISKDF